MNKTNLNELETEDRLYRDNKGESKKSRTPYKREKSRNWLNELDFETELSNYQESEYGNK
jgi:hypothetical protein